ncbi:MAG: M50 family metallopeptidase [Pyrinomonadaceae bacterium]|nr:M50 family metallopeptidase [Pyrinomonadaceae bacterium]
MKFEIAEESKPQLKLLILATLLSVGIWFASWYFPVARYLVYPLQLFATFVHEGSHVLAALMTGGSVQSLTVSPDTSGAVWSMTNSWLSQMITSSAGYLGTTFFGILLLVWFRYKFSSRNALYLTSGFVGVMTLVFGLLAPMWNFLTTKVGIGSVLFTVISGVLLSGGLFAIGRYAPLKWVNFSIAFLAVQCLLNSFFSLKTLFFISATTDSHSDAMNMAQATGIPAIAWVMLWIVVSIVMISVGLRLYAVSSKSANNDLPFED